MLEIISRAKELYDILTNGTTKWTAKVLALIEFAELLKPLFKQPLGDALAEAPVDCEAVTAEEALANLTSYCSLKGEGHEAIGDGKFLKLLAQFFIKVAPLILTIL